MRIFCNKNVEYSKFIEHYRQNRRLNLIEFACNYGLNTYRPDPIGSEQAGGIIESSSPRPTKLVGRGYFFSGMIAISFSLCYDNKNKTNEEIL